MLQFDNKSMYFEVKTLIFNEIMISYSHQNYLENVFLAMQILLYALGQPRFFLGSIIYPIYSSDMNCGSLNLKGFIVT